MNGIIGHISIIAALAMASTSPGPDRRQAQGVVFNEALSRAVTVFNNRPVFNEALSRTVTVFNNRPVFNEAISRAATICNGALTEGSPDCDANGFNDDCQPDIDSDGIIDGCDPDDDNDGVPDVDDLDPLDPNVCEDVDGDSCDDCAVGSDGFGPLPDADPANDGSDSDGDGLCDTGDNCPMDVNPGQEDCDGDGTGDACETCPQDLNGDGVIDAADLALLLGAWGPNPGHCADFNHDGMVDAADLAQLLGNWGPCPS